MDKRGKTGSSIVILGSGIFAGLLFVALPISGQPLTNNSEQIAHNLFKRREQSEDG